MIQLSDRIGRMNESQTIAMAQKSRELASKGIDVINLSLGEPDFQTPDYVKKAAKEAIDQNYSYYTPVAGYLDLRIAIANKLERENHLQYSADQIVVSTGAKQSLINVVLSILNPGDEVIIPAPYWVSYIEMVKMASATPVIVPCPIEQNFKITPDQLEQYISPKTRMFLFSSPCNPTGSVYSREELKLLADVLKKYPQLVILSDEIYEYINFVGPHQSIAQFEEVRNQTVVVNGLSKGFAMTGWRLGYIAAPLEIAKACDKIQGQFTSATCSITQRAAITALEPGHNEFIAMREAFHRRRDLVLEGIQQIEGIRPNIPEGAFYVFPDISYYFGKSWGNYRIQNADDLCNYLLSEAHVAVVTGNAFGDPNCIRISYATSEEKLILALKRLKTSLDQLN